MTEDKLIRKFLTDKTHITVDDCDRLLVHFGYHLNKGGGSHRCYHQKGLKPITIVQPKGKKYIGIAYVNRLLKELKLEESNEKGDNDEK